MACLLRTVLALAVCVTHLPIAYTKQRFGGLVKTLRRVTDWLGWQSGTLRAH